MPTAAEKPVHRCKHYGAAAGYCGCGFFLRCAHCDCDFTDHITVAQTARSIGYKCLYGPDFYRCELEDEWTITPA